MLPDAGPVGATHGFVPDWQTWPTNALPFAMPFTDHVTVASDEFVTVAEKDARSFDESVAVGGETITPTALVTVTVAAAVMPPGAVA